MGAARCNELNVDDDHWELSLPILIECDSGCRVDSKITKSAFQHSSHEGAIVALLIVGLLSFAQSHEESEPLTVQLEVNFLRVRVNRYRAQVLAKVCFRGEDKVPHASNHVLEHSLILSLVELVLVEHINVINDFPSDLKPEIFYFSP